METPTEDLETKIRNLKEVLYDAVRTGDMELAQTVLKRIDLLEGV